MRSLVAHEIPIGQHINPDDIARHIALQEHIQKTARYLSQSAPRCELSREFQATLSALLAQTIAKGLRQEWLGHRLSLTYESVMSHESHLDFIDQAKEAGFKPYLYYICTSNPEIHKARVRERVFSGGHDVPDEKIESRYNKSLALLETMARKCHRAYFFDNSGIEHLHFAEITPDGYLDIFEKEFNKAHPTWFIENLLKKWEKKKARLATF
jgi:predicted ABC-type ATPase